MTYREPRDEFCDAERREYFVEVLNDDASHGLIVGEFFHWKGAADFYERLMRGPSHLRLVMRQMMHVYRSYTPDRLKPKPAPPPAFPVPPDLKPNEFVCQRCGGIVDITSNATFMAHRCYLSNA